MYPAIAIDFSHLAKQCLDFPFSPSSTLMKLHTHIPMKHSAHCISSYLIITCWWTSFADQISLPRCVLLTDELKCSTEKVQCSLLDGLLLQAYAKRVLKTNLKLRIILRKIVLLIHSLWKGCAKHRENVTKRKCYISLFLKGSIL